MRRDEPCGESFHTMHKTTPINLAFVFLFVSKIKIDISKNENI